MIFFKRLFSKNKIELKINDGGRTAAGFKGKTGDCAVRSIAIATNLPYKKIYRDLYKANENFITVITSVVIIAKGIKVSEK